MSILQILILALVQGAAELLPVSSSAHVIVAEKLMGLDPSLPDMTFLLVMLHTGTMFAVIAYFWKRWKRFFKDEPAEFLKRVAIATVFTGVIGVVLKHLIEKFILHPAPGMGKAEIESLFKSLPLIGAALFAAGTLIVIAGFRDGSPKQPKPKNIDMKDSVIIGIIQGLCLPFRGFSRSGATISTALLRGIKRSVAEDFSFALAVVLTPPVIVLELRRLLKHSADGAGLSGAYLSSLLAPSFVGMVFAFASGMLALRWLSSWLENGKWKYFGFYCWVASAVVFGMAWAGY